MTMTMTETRLPSVAALGHQSSVLAQAACDICETTEGVIGGLCDRCADFADVFVGYDRCSDCGGAGASIDGVCDLCWVDRHRVDDELDDDSW